jgi:plasmanylethanolamine desaturase
VATGGAALDWQLCDWELWPGELRAASGVWETTVMLRDVLLCILTADFLTGVIHWAEDTYGVPTWPLLGPAVIEPNIVHHERPALFTAGNLWHRNYQVFYFGAAAIGIVYLTGWLTWQFTLTACLASLGNEVHAWTHKRPRSRLARLLQDMRLVISPEQHARHHRPPYDVCFCTLTNVLNPLLDACRFWRGLEWMLSAIGIAPMRMSSARRFR